MLLDQMPTAAQNNEIEEGGALYWAFSLHLGLSPSCGKILLLIEVIQVTKLPARWAVMEASTSLSRIARRVMS